VHFLKFPFDLVKLAVGLFGPPEDFPSLSPVQGSVETMVDIDRFHQGNVEYSVTAITAIDLAANTVLVGFLHGIKDLVHLGHEVLIFGKGFWEVKHYRSP
jgi:hypothetical protein